VRLAHKHDALVKVILETAVLSDQEKVIACLIAKESVRISSRHRQALPAEEQPWKILR